MTKPVRFTQSDVTRALKATQAAGFSPVEVQILPDGAIKVRVESGEAEDARGWGEEG